MKITVPEKTLLAFAQQGEIKSALPPDGGDAEKLLAAFAHAGVDVLSLAAELQRDGTAAFSRSWNELIALIATKTVALAQVNQA